MPVVELVLIEQRAVGLDQRLDARLRALRALGECLLRDLDEPVGLVAVGPQPSAVGDDGVAVRIDARVLPGQEPHVATELAREYVVKIGERGGGVGGPRLERAELGVGVAIYPGGRTR